MTILKICVYFMTLFSCQTKNIDKIVVIGEAQNTKAGATVIAKDDRKLYYVDGFTHWDTKVIGKLVKVTGVLFIENKARQNDDGELKQQIEGVKRIIQKPKWRIVK